MVLNFPSRTLAKLMQWLIFPPWRNYRLPSDSLDLEIGKHMMANSEFRSRITAYCYESNDSSDPSARIELAWLKMIEVEPLLNKLDYAVKQGKLDKNLRMLSKIKSALEQSLINEEQAKILMQFEDMRLDAMQVDEFTSAELTGKIV
jgi:acyl-CoA dehydrogenase